MKILHLIGLTIAALSISSCGNKSQQPTAQNTDDSTVEMKQDKTIFGICGEGSAMNTLQIITDNGDTLTLSVADARENNKVHGGYGYGDRMAVIPNTAKDEAELVINETSLLGNWIMPNPIDGSSVVGISLKDGGIAESIEQSSIIYKTWKISEGRLEIMSTRDGGGDLEETNSYEIVKLDADSLV